MSRAQQVPISQSLIELFEKVQLQAQQYATIYETLLRKSYELDRLRASSYQEFDKLKHDAHELLKNLTTKVDNYLEQVHQEHKYIEEVYVHLSSIEQLHNRLITLEERFTKRTVELDAVLLTIRQLVEKSTEDRFRTLEDYIGGKLHTVEGNISALDSHIYATQEFLKKEIAQLNEELARFKRKIPETRYIIDETNKYIISLLEEAEHRFQEKLNKASAQVDERISQALSKLFAEANLAADLARANTRTQELLSRAAVLERKMSISLWLSLSLGGVALILALITIIS